MESILVIGGGASGLAAAIAAAEALSEAGAGGAVELCEADERVGRSILATGNGRCNFSNAAVRASDYRNAPFVGGVLQALSASAAASGASSPQRCPADPVHRFFAEGGLAWREESEGRLYPLANKAASVLDVLRFRAEAAGVRVRTSRTVERVEAPRGPNAPFFVRFSDGGVAHPRAVVLACGGKHARAVALPEGIEARAASDVLGPLRSDARLTRPLNNVRVRCSLWLYRPDVAAARADVAADMELRMQAAAAAAACADERGCAPESASLVGEAGALLAHQRGELLFRDYGVSGIAVFNLSRYAREGDALLVDLLPDVPARDAVDVMLRRFRLMTARRRLTVREWSAGLLLPSVSGLVLEPLGLRADDAFGEEHVASFARAAKAVRLPLRGGADAAQCQVRRGGLAVSGFDSRTLESKRVPGLFAAGEALDVDGPCGGYNLHWAWASGLLAGRGAAALLSREGGADGSGR